MIAAARLDWSTNSRRNRAADFELVTLSQNLGHDIG